MAHVLKAALMGQDPALSRSDACGEEVSLMDPFPFATLGIVFFYGLALGSAFRRFIAAPLAKRLFAALYPTMPEGQTLSKRERSTRSKRSRKFVASLLEMVIYTVFFLMGCRLLWRQDWIWPSARWWDDTPSTEMPTDLAFFYLSYASRYMCQFAFVFLDPRKSDFVEMQTHHVVTITLVCVSYAYRMVRIGLLIMVVFDVADPFLHLAKLVTYCKEASPNESPQRKFFSVVADILFALFAVVFFVTRIVLYSYITYSATYESFVYMSPNKNFFEGLVECSLATHICVLLVWAIYALQCFWFNLLVKVIVKALKGEELKDERSEAEEEESNSDVKKRFNVDKVD